MVFPFHHRRANQREKPPSQRLPSGSARNRNGGRAGPTSLPGLLTREGGRGGERPNRAGRNKPPEAGAGFAPCLLSCVEPSERRPGRSSEPERGSAAANKPGEKTESSGSTSGGIGRNFPKWESSPRKQIHPPGRNRERGAARNKKTEAGADFGKYFQRPRPEAGEQGAGKVSERVHFPPSKHRAGGRSRHRDRSRISRASGPRERFEGGGGLNRERN